MECAASLRRFEPMGARRAKARRRRDRGETLPLRLEARQNLFSGEAPERILGDRAIGTSRVLFHLYDLIP
jgi:hypothetical protein